jgi:soluble lytic murein transglycosylase
VVRRNWRSLTASSRSRLCTFDSSRRSVSVLGTICLFLSTSAAIGARGVVRPPSELKAGVSACENGDYASGASKLRAFSKRSPKLADYAGYQAAVCLASAHRSEEAVSALDAVWRMKPRSPVIGKAALLAAAAHLDANHPAKARQVLSANWDELPQPNGELLLARSYEALGDGAIAAAHYQKVYFKYPASTAETEATAGLDRLREQLGNNFPPPMSADMFERADLLIKTRDYERARKELEAWALQFRGEDRELARVRLGAAGFLANETGTACAYLRSLASSAGEAEAERLYYVAECAHHDDSGDAIAGALATLERDHAHSPWRLKALVRAGNRYLVRNQPERYAPYYRACYASFPSTVQAAHCHWKVAWSAYLARRADARAMLREHLENFPTSDHAPAALYFLARMLETSGDTGAAKALYLKLRVVYPASYYRMLARKRLEEAALAGAKPSAAAAESLGHLASPVPNPPPSFQPDAVSLARMERARLLAEAGFPDWAETELRFGARHGGQAYVLAAELARMAAQRDAPAQGIRYIKAVARGYLTLSPEDAPDSFWRLAFPLPYRALVERNASANNLDPHIVAGLIRQESEFDHEAVSRSGARGLTQVMPATGKQLGRELGIKRFRAAMLFQPEINLQLGTHYLRSILNQFDGRWEPALAAYNAGASRSKAWLSWGEFREPAEFVESIPFSETRNYVQIVLRNADTYRALYAQNAPAAKPARPKKKTRARRR